MFMSGIRTPYGRFLPVHLLQGSFGSDSLWTKKGLSLPIKFENYFFGERIMQGSTRDPCKIILRGGGVALTEEEGRGTRSGYEASKGSKP